MNKIGSIVIPRPFCQAGLAGYSDRAMRLVARRRGCPYAVTEALLDTIMLAGGLGLKRSIDINDEDHPIAGQLVGADPETLAPAARILHDHQYDVIDLNFACPVKKIKNKERGGYLLHDLPAAVGILRAVRDVIPSGKPITLSLRKSFDDTPESQEKFYAIVEEAFGLGFAAIRVHARTVAQKYQGKADWSFTASLKKHYPDKTILASGDVFCAEDVVRILKETGADFAWIARGAIGNPWIFQQAMDLMEGKPINPPTILQQRQALEEHFDLAMKLHGESLAGRRMRKFGIKYSRFHPLREEVKTAFINVMSLRQWTVVLNQYYNTDGPGVFPASNAADEVNCEE